MGWNPATWLLKLVPDMPKTNCKQISTIEIQLPVSDKLTRNQCWEAKTGISVARNKWGVFVVDVFVAVGWVCVFVSAA